MYVTYTEWFQLLSVLIDFGLLIVTIVALIYQNKKK
ncbi:MAG: putative holin-like toxin [Eubacteriales bacterium]|nr:putative holin-like toxin [Eubacteriales bacterium]